MSKTSKKPRVPTARIHSVWTPRTDALAANINERREGIYLEACDVNDDYHDAMRLARTLEHELIQAREQLEHVINLIKK